MRIRFLSAFALFSYVACAPATPEPEMYSVGCGDGVLIACDNQNQPNPHCNPDFEHEPMTIALHDSKGGSISGRLIDEGDGVPYETLEGSIGSWMKIRVCGRSKAPEGWVNWKEGFVARTRIRLRQSPPAT
jgi:hypothetical protein